MVAKTVRAVVEGDPPSATHQVSNREMRDLLEQIEALAALGGFAYVRNSLTQLNAVSGSTSGQYGLVISTASDAGIYERVGSSWVKRGDIPTVLTETLSQQEAAASAAAALASQLIAVPAAAAAAASADLALARADDITAFGGFRDRTDLATLLADTTFTYTSGLDGTVVAGEIIRTRAEGFSVRVLPAASVNPDLTTAGSVKLQVLPGADGLNLRAFGAAGDGVTDDTAAIQAWIAALGAGTFKQRGTLPAGRYRHTAPLVWSNYRNLHIQGTGGNIVGYGTSFEFAGNSGNPDHVSGGVKFLSCYNVSVEGVLFVNRTVGLDYHFRVDANPSPALSGSIIRFESCNFQAAPGCDCAEAGILVANNKFVRFNQGFTDYKSERDFRFGLDIAESPTTLMTGTAALCSVKDFILFGDIDVRNISGLTLEGLGMDDRLVSAGASSVTTSGEEKTVGLIVRNCGFTQDKSTGTDLRPAISTGSYAGTASFSPSAGVVVTGCSFRDRGIGVNIARGGVSLSGNVFQLRDVAHKGVVIESGVSNAAAINIDSSNDFSMGDTNNCIAIEDNRTTLSDQVTHSNALAADLTIPAVGSYQTVLSASTNRALRGGKYRLTYQVVILVSASGAGNYRAQCLIAGADADTIVRTTGGNSEYITLQCSRIIKLTGTTGAVTVTLRVEQATGAASLVRALTNGSTFVQLEELP